MSSPGDLADMADFEPGQSATAFVADRPLPWVDLHGLRIHAISEAQTIRHIIGRLALGQGGCVITPNLDHVRRVSRQPEFREMYAQAELVVADGMPLIWASRLQGTPLPGRVAGSTLISTLSAAAGEARHSVYLLGGVPGTADAAARILAQRCPGLSIAGTHCPPVGFEKDPAAMRRIMDDLAATSPDIVYVGLGSPKQERLIWDIRHCLPRAWWLGVGVSFSFLCGDVQRAPRWMQRLGLEWAHRLWQEPGRLARRYLIDGLPFAARLLGGAAIRRFTRRESLAGR